MMVVKHRNQLLLLLIFLLSVAIQLTSALDYLFNGFGPNDVILFRDATIEPRRHVLALTRHTHALYPSSIPTKQPNSSIVLPFSTSFIFASVIYPDSVFVRGADIRFCFVPRLGTDCYYSAPGFGIHMSNKENIVTCFNSTNPVVVGHGAGYWPDDGREFMILELTKGMNYQAWIDYAEGVVNVSMAPAGTKRPNRPLLSPPLNLSRAFEDEMFVGFFTSMPSIQINKILGWSFSNTNFSFSEGLITNGLPDFQFTLLQKTKFVLSALFDKDGNHLLTFLIAIGCFLILISVLTCPVVACFLVTRSIKSGVVETEGWELEYWPHRISYREIESATNKFSEANVVGVGGNGKVYRGVLSVGSEVAVKRFSGESNQGIAAFSAEISSLGRLKHRSLVGLRGWCKKDKCNLFLVYDYMENGSLDKRVFECEEESRLLNCEERIKILKQVACGVDYLHCGWESRVIHRDIKASNVLLDKEMNGRLGDFGLALIHDDDCNICVDRPTARVIGTVGYLAPEILTRGLQSTQTDVFGFGILVLEVLCGRRPVEQDKPLLVDLLWELLRKGQLIRGADRRLRANGGFDDDKVEKLLRLGLLCAHRDPDRRPTMSQVVRSFEMKTEEELDEAQGEEQTEEKDNHLFSTFQSILEEAADGDIRSMSWSRSMGTARTDG